MRIVRPLLLPLLALACALVLSTPSLANYLQVNLVSDGFVANTLVDPNLVNPWGLASSPTSPFWIADNGTGVSSLYNATTNTIPSLVVTIPGGSPIGITWNDNPSAFPVGPNTGAVFLFASEEGRIAGWHPSLGTTASVQADVPGASYTGLTMHTQTGNSLLYAADFAQGTVDVFDATVQPTLAGAFLDPNLPAGLSPFNVQVLGNEVYVAYARRDPVTGDEVPGAGLGLVNVFDRTGNLLRRVATGGTLNAPWGLALAPASFGEFAGALLVGNFGDGRINAFDPLSGTFLGQVRNPNKAPIEIDGLWALRFGNDGGAGSANELFFTAGIEDETHGLFGKLVVTRAIPEPETLRLLAAALVMLIAVRAMVVRRPA